MSDTALSEAARAVAKLPLDRPERRNAIAGHRARVVPLLFGARRAAT